MCCGQAVGASAMRALPVSGRRRATRCTVVSTQMRAIRAAAAITTRRARGCARSPHAAYCRRT